MPLYDYECQACGQITEFLQHKNDKDKTQCPHCNAPKLKKMVSSAAFQLKGSGWYVTDFKDKKTKKPSNDGDQKSTNSDTKQSKDSDT